MMKLTRRALLGKVSFGIAGLWATLRGGGRSSEWHREGDQYVSERVPCGGRYYPREALAAAVDDFWQKETGQPYEHPTFPVGYTYFCTDDGDEANDGLSPESPIPFRKALELVEIGESIRWFGPDGSATGYGRTV